MAKKKSSRQYTGTPDERLIAEEFDLSKRLTKRAYAQDATIKVFDMTGEVLRRRKATTQAYMARVKERYKDKNPDFDVVQAWARHNAGACFSINLEAAVRHLTLAAAIWMLDELKSRDRLKDAYKYFYKDAERLESFYIPVFFDAWHDDSVIRGMMYLILHRDEKENTLECYINDVTAARTKPVDHQMPADNRSSQSPDELGMSPRERFNAIMSMIHPDAKRWAVERFEAKQWEFLDLFFGCCEILSVELAAAERESNRCHEEALALKRAIDEVRKNARNPQKPKLPLAVQAPVMPQAFSLSGMPTYDADKTIEDNLDKLRRAATRGLAVEEKEDNLLFQLTSLHFFAPRAATFSLANEGEKELPVDMMAQLKQFEVDDPYETCFAFLYLLELGSDSAWLYNTNLALLSAAARKLPWGAEMFADKDKEWDEFAGEQWDEREVDDKDDQTEVAAERVEMPVFDPLSMPIRDGNEQKAQLYKLKYNDIQYFSPYRCYSDERKLNLPQLVFAASRLVMPRNVSSQAGEAEDLVEAGMDPAAAAIMELYFQLAEDVQYPSKDWEAFLQSDRFQQISKLYGSEMSEEEPEESFDEVVDTDALQEQIRVLQKKNDDLRQMLYTATKQAEQNEIEARHILNETANEHQELLDLRELVFHRANQEEEREEADQRIKVELPYSTKQRVVVFGGHDTWLKAIRPLLPEVTFINRGQNPNTEMIRAADVVWIQANALSHDNYYKIINTVRAHRIPVRYFGYASARKCAEQLVLDDMKH